MCCIIYIWYGGYSGVKWNGFRNEDDPLATNTHTQTEFIFRPFSLLAEVDRSMDFSDKQIHDF